MKTFILLSCLAALAVSKPQDISFPGLEENEGPGKMPERLSGHRLPLYAPDICPVNHLYYPGDQESDWVCDCALGYIYYPPKNGCFRAYRQGPCAVNQYLILPKGKVIPECQNNPCENDGFVSYQGKCYELDNSGPPCKPANEGGGIFGVNATTLELECLKGEESLSLINFPPNCPPGSRRSVNYCRPEY